MLNSKYYKGFEGEPALVLDNGENKLIIWNGYFESILESLLETNLEKEGIIKEYFYHEGWYDDSPWALKDIQLTIKQLKNFDLSKVYQSDNIKNVLPDLVQEIIQFLEYAKNENVVITYD
ncbi:hypothetical protein [Metabacillus fastidiosus]|uniref:hypothetical protein n=1 Tax=Metabacillus fastidiosus TaxID=1458 RepID=UPI002DBC4FB5|nr:hypothetical protein [Metabacillus fastidiosus]MEC2077034.1 hypothetical protein [Metabacillus fastidiosus]